MTFCCGGGKSIASAILVSKHSVTNYTFSGGWVKFVSFLVGDLGTFKIFKILPIYQEQSVIRFLLANLTKTANNLAFTEFATRLTARMRTKSI